MEQNAKAEEIWKQAFQVYRASLVNESDVRRMERYFPLFVSKRIDGNDFLVGVHEEMQVEWFTDEFAQPLTLAVKSVDPALSVKFVVDKEAPAPLSNLPPPKQPAPVAPAPAPAPRPVRLIASTLPLNDHYTFENFVRGPSNSFAFAAANAVAKGPGANNPYNPLFIWGGTGLGKTHLMQAIGNRVLANDPGISVCYLTSETFLNEYINAIANASLPAFRERYRKVDVLLIDDVQFIASKKQFQEEFFNTFNDLLIWHKQIVMTSDIAPRDMHGLEERLTSRFSAGMVVEIESPSYETRLAILKSKNHNTVHPVGEDVLKYIAENITSHVRALEGALCRVSTFVEINPAEPLTIEIAHQLLKDSIDEERTIKELSIADIMKSVAEYYGVKVEDVKSQERTATLVTPRQMAMFLSRKLTTRSLQEIGTAFGKNHSTVLYGAASVKKRLDVDADLRKAVEQITAQLGRRISDVLKNDVLK